ncbi:hypothetical protein ACFZCY_22420 [Streptomyces sp. NPDC007983]|uniref:hypothetical protein n=1 Tax=Streptomyces sp. NPDC007983 TaxID=3364800 RepID=UPI0036E65F25
MPLDGHFDVDPEHPGEDRGGHFGGEGEQRGGAVLLGPDPDLVEGLADPIVAEGMLGALPGNSQGTSSGVLILALPRRVAAASLNSSFSVPAFVW